MPVLSSLGGEETGLFLSWARAEASFLKDLDLSLTITLTLT